MFLNLEYIFALIYDFFTGAGNGSIGADSFDSTLFIVKAIMWTIAILAIAATIYFQLQAMGLRRELEKSLVRATKSAAKPMQAKNRDWERLVGMVESDNPAEWKIAVLDADKMLEALTVQLGFYGDSLGERLKNADPSRMRTLQSAWEGHKIRNAIAHEPNHVLTKREARRAMTMFETVFREFSLV